MCEYAYTAISGTKWFIRIRIRTAYKFVIANQFNMVAIDRKESPMLEGECRGCAKILCNVLREKI